MEALKKSRKVLKTQVTMLKKEVDGYTNVPPNIGTLKAHEQRIDLLGTQIGDNWNSVAILCQDDTEYNAQSPYYEDVIAKVSEIKAIIINTVATVTAAQQPAIPIPTTQPAASVGNPGTTVRLPTIELPSFSGDLREWMTFHDLFKATIDCHPTLKPAQKLQYLKANLTGAAHGVLGSVQVIDANYAPAWQRLVDRYHNERELVFDTIKRLVNQSKLHSESASTLRQLVDVTRECIRSLEALNRKPSDWSDILVYLLIQKLDDNTRRSWELSLKDKKVPNFDSFIDFLEQQAHALGSLTLVSTHKHNLRSTDEKQKTKAHHASNTVRKCQCCDGEHAIFRCDIFLKMTVEERKGIVKRRSLCFNCLSSGHRVDSCKSGGCRSCQKKHHTTLHETSKTKVENSTTVSALTSQDSTSKVLLATLLVRVRDSFGKMQECRAFVDSGSESSFMTMSCAKRLHLKQKRVNVGISGLATSDVATARSRVNFSISPHFSDNYSLNVNALVLAQVTATMPNRELDISGWEHIQGLQLADPHFNIPAKVDILLGADVAADIALSNCCRGEPHLPIAQQSKLGWIVFGRTSSLTPSTIANHHLTVTLDEAVRKFWEIEEVPNYSAFSVEERHCLTHYANTYARTKNGRFIVHLPLKDDFVLGNSKAMAVRRFTQLERRLANHPEFKAQYHQVMQEYLDLGHLQLVPENELQMSDKQTFYLPHHAVIKESSTSTKVRVVFDGSAKSSSGQSLNNCMMVGPVVQSDLFTILLRFRRWQIALTADIVKMYRQILITPEQSNLQRILWRFQDNEPIREYKSVTVTFGTASAPFLATQTICQLAHDEASTYPVAAPVLLKDAYVDDIATGANHVEQAIELYKQLDGITKSACFELSKWVSNSATFMEVIPESNRGTQFPLNFTDDDFVKSLGLYWHPSTDCFKFTVAEFNFDQKLTKRIILSDTAKLFDPLGWMSPVTISPKLFLQTLWKENLDWDETLPYSTTHSWTTYRKSLPLIQDVQLPRCAIIEHCVNLQLHGFSDASEKAYSACVYLRSVSRSGKVHVQLLAAKTRVAPLKLISLPRLELCGAVLLVKLITAVSKCFDITFDEVHAWCDSTITLAWIRSPSHQWKTFVGNRVSEIQGCSPQPIWHHISGTNNPADCASRGILPEEVINHSLWWTGPDFLLKAIQTEEQISTPDPEYLVEQRKQKVNVNHARSTESILNRYSCLTKLQRAVCWLVRLYNYHHSQCVFKGELTVCELRNATQRLVLVAQREVFSEEIKSLSTGKPLSRKSKLTSLNPFIDPDGCIRVGGRLENAPQLTYNRKHPLILPAHHHLTTLIVRHLHQAHLHAGPTLLVHLLQQKYWIIQAKNVVKFQIRKCIVCTRTRAETAKQLMGNLPASRVTPTRAFLNCGVDYAGPLLLRPMKGRSNKLFKCYIALFVCFSTRAIHLEAVSDMTSDSFLAALHRFISRRGLPAEIHSDCGTNFVGAAKELRHFIELTRSSQFNSDLTKALSAHEISWKFNPPSAPHMGGIWEAGVKSTKYHLHRVVGDRTLNFEELCTLLAKIEACLNSRPLCAATDNVDDLNVLTPGHFLIHDSLIAVPEPSYDHLKLNTLSRWQLIQLLSQQFWQRWSSEYLTRLQQRPKWATYQPNIEVGQLVLIKDERLPPQQWLLARIVAVHPGADSLVRVVTVKTKYGEMKRPVTKLCPLPICKEE